MPRKMAGLDPLPPFRVPEVTAVIRAASLHCHRRRTEQIAMKDERVAFIPGVAPAASEGSSRTDLPHCNSKGTPRRIGAMYEGLVSDTVVPLYSARAGSWDQAMRVAAMTTMGRLINYIDESPFRSGFVLLPAKPKKGSPYSAEVRAQVIAMLRAAATQRHSTA
jgi:hypothetical protein